MRVRSNRTTHRGASLLHCMMLTTLYRKVPSERGTKQNTQRASGAEPFSAPASGSFSTRSGHRVDGLRPRPPEFPTATAERLASLWWSRPRAVADDAVPHSSRCGGAGDASADRPQTTLFAAHLFAPSTLRLKRAGRKLLPACGARDARQLDRQTPNVVRSFLSSLSSQ